MNDGRDRLERLVIHLDGSLHEELLKHIGHGRLHSRKVSARLLTLATIGMGVAMGRLQSSELDALFIGNTQSEQDLSPKTSGRKIKEIPQEQDLGPGSVTAEPTPRPAVKDPVVPAPRRPPPVESAEANVAEKVPEPQATGAQPPQKPAHSERSIAVANGGMAEAESQESAERRKRMARRFV